MTLSIAKPATNGHSTNGHGAEDSKRSYAATTTVLDVPNLIQVQLDSFEWFKSDGLKDLFEEISPIEDSPGARFELSLGDHYFEDPKYTEEECREKEITYSAPLYVTVTLEIKASGTGHGEIKEQTLFIGGHPDDDEQWDLRYQRSRARRGEPACALSRAFISRLRRIRTRVADWRRRS